MAAAARRGCGAALGLLRQVEPVIMLEQVGNTFFDTALLVVVGERSGDRQEDIADFYLTYNLIVRFAPILPSLLLAVLGDRGRRRTPVVLPLCGYLLSRLLLLLVLLCRLPLGVMFAAAALFGLCGGFSAFWSGVMTLVSLRSLATERSKVMMRLEFLYGITGLLASLASGHLFLLCASSLGGGTLLLLLSSALHLLCLGLAAFLLQVDPAPPAEPEENRLLPPLPDGVPAADAPAGVNKVNLLLLFSAGFLYDFAVGGAVAILGFFVLKAPLSWNAVQVGYGNAAGCTIFLTSFLGVLAFRRCMSEETLILIGMVSFAAGIYLMAFATTSAVFYTARFINLFALIPMPTIRSLLSQQVPESACGKTLTGLQMTLKVAGLIYIPVFTSLYQKTLDRLPGAVFMLAAAVTVLAMIPISVLGCRSANAPRRQRLEDEQEARGGPH